MAMYVATILVGNEIVEFATGSDEASTRAALEAELERRFPGGWIRVNDQQYSFPGSSVGCRVLGHIREDLTVPEDLQRRRQGWLQTIRDLEARLLDLEAGLVEARQAAAWYDKQIAKHISTEHAASDR